MENKPKGFGDTLANFLEMSGVKIVVNKMQKATGREPEDCGCKGRQEKLNKIFPYKNKK
tara:strand:+ start:7438 stop:7614 length:177 start_codon:yes stop_codon:yes gene_type:complete